jgi:hypothetical protein
MTQNFINTIIFSNSEDPVHDPMNEVIQFQFDPLAFVLHCIENSMPLTDVHTMLSDQSNYEDHCKNVVIGNSNCKNKSEQIQKYYKNRLLLRRIKGHKFSDYNNNLEEMLENIRSIKKSQISILTKLPNFYNEDIATTELLNRYKSLPEDTNYQSANINDVFTYAGKIQRSSKASNIIRYYFANKNNELLIIPHQTGSSSCEIMDYVVRQNKPIRIEGVVTVESQPVKEDFLLYSRGVLKFYEANS